MERTSGTNLRVSRNICFSLKNIYAPEGFNPESTVLACGFPKNTTSIECRNFMSWIAPVVYVERTTSFSSEANFVVVFSSNEQASVLDKQSFSYDGMRTEIVCRMVDKEQSFWESFISSPPVSRIRNVLTLNSPVQSSTAVSDFTNKAGESMVSGWNAVTNNEIFENLASTITPVKSQLLEKTEALHSAMMQKQK